MGFGPTPALSEPAPIARFLSRSPEAILAEIIDRLHIEQGDDGSWIAPAEPQPIEDYSLASLIERIANLSDPAGEQSIAGEPEKDDPFDPEKVERFFAQTGIAQFDEDNDKLLAMLRTQPSERGALERAVKLLSQWLEREERFTFLGGDTQIFLNEISGLLPSPPSQASE